MEQVFSSSILKSIDRALSRHETTDATPIQPNARHAAKTRQRRMSVCPRPNQPKTKHPPPPFPSQHGDHHHRETRRGRRGVSHKQTHPSKLPFTYLPPPPPRARKTLSSGNDSGDKKQQMASPFPDKSPCHHHTPDPERRVTVGDVGDESLFFVADRRADGALLLLSTVTNAWDRRSTLGGVFVGGGGEGG